jgi:hypothetical protein
MGLMFLGYGVAAAAFYVFITKTARMAPESASGWKIGHVDSNVAEVVTVFDKKAA